MPDQKRAHHKHQQDDRENTNDERYEGITALYRLRGNCCRLVFSFSIDSALAGAILSAAGSSRFPDQTQRSNTQSTPENSTNSSITAVKLIKSDNIPATDHCQQVPPFFEDVLCSVFLPPPMTSITTDSTVMTANIPNILPTYFIPHSRIARNADCGISTLPTCFMAAFYRPLFFHSFFTSVISPP